VRYCRAARQRHKKQLEKKNVEKVIQASIQHTDVMLTFLKLRRVVCLRQLNA
jgi:hypothetical protein